MKHDQRFLWLDLIRGASAIAVCAGHLRNAELANYRELDAPGLAVKFVYLISGFGHQAVMVFFVLSGLFVGGSILKAGEKFRFGEYAIARLTRLWVVLLPALALTFAIDRVVVAYAPEVMRGAYYSYWHSGPSPGRAYSVSGLTFIGNLLFVHTIWTPVFGTNGPLWSLANEFWYYATFPLLAYGAGLCGAARTVPPRMLGAVAAAFIMIWLPYDMLVGYMVWLMGVAVAVICARLEHRPRPLAFSMALVFFLLCLAYSKSGGWQTALGLREDIVVGAGFAAFCIVMAVWPPPRNDRLRAVAKKFAGAVSEVSYSLYLSHFPLLIGIAVLGFGCRKELPSRLGLLHYFEILGVLIAFGALFWFLFERHTGFIRSVVRRRLVGRLEGVDG
jgi:peptidoglycan/LPS O-acetylase OafA/YrhL